MKYYTLLNRINQIDKNVAVLEMLVGVGRDVNGEIKADMNARFDIKAERIKKIEDDIDSIREKLPSSREIWLYRLFIAGFLLYIFGGLK